MWKWVRFAARHLLVDFADEPDHERGEKDEPDPKVEPRFKLTEGDLELNSCAQCFHGGAWEEPTRAHRHCGLLIQTHWIKRSFWFPHMGHIKIPANFSSLGVKLITKDIPTLVRSRVCVITKGLCFWMLECLWPKMLDRP